MSQRLALTMALVGSPDLLILDEPTAGLDLNSTRELGRSSRLKVTAVWPCSSPVTSSNRSRPSPTASES
jgi:ABC-type sulfate/molybdate transport systems ATPase subunit